jgi:hypothetical protein
MSILEATDNLRNTVNDSTTPIAVLALFQASLAMCVNYAFFCRVETGLRYHTGDLTIHRPSGHICLYIRKSKVDHRRNVGDKLLMAFPITANPMLAELLEWYLLKRTIA